MKFTSTSFKYAGRVNDEIWTSSGLRGIARRRIRPATPETRLQFAALFSLEPARVAWRNLGSATQTDWTDLAASTFGYPLQGSPRYMDGENFFANFYTVLLTQDEFAPVPDVPSGGPTWQSKPKFWEFATWESGTYTLKAETEFDYDTVLLFSGLPPTTSVYKPEFQREVFIGTETLSYGLYADEEYPDVHYMMENTFGTITESMKIWGRIWEIQDGYIRTLKDPCTPDPTEVTVGNVIDFEVFNDWDATLSYNTFDAYTEEFELIGNASFGPASPYGTATGSMTLDSPYTRDDVDHFDYWVEWEDGESFGDGLGYAQEEFYEYSANPYG